MCLISGERMSSSLQPRLNNVRIFLAQKTEKDQILLQIRIADKHPAL